MSLLRRCLAIVGLATLLVGSGWPAGGVGEARSSGPVEIQRRYQGWFVWSCWDEAQRVVIEIGSARIDAGGKVVADGTEHYEVAHGFRAVAVRLVLDRRTGGFELWETDADSDGDALLVGGGPLEGRIVLSGEAMDLMAISEGEGCEPKVLLEGRASDEVVVLAGE